MYKLNLSYAIKNGTDKEYHVNLLKLSPLFRFKFIQSKQGIKEGILKGVEHL